MVENSIYDCVIIGGGPGGLSAGIYLSRFRCNVKLIDGNNSRAALIACSHNFPGAIEGISGKKILADLRQQYEKYANLIINDEVVDISNGSDYFTIEAKNSKLYAKNIILATGVVDIEPHLPKLELAIKKGLIRHCLICDAYEVINKKIAIIGNGANAIKEAILMQTYSSDVTVFLDNIKTIVPREIKKKAEEHHIPIIYDAIAEVIIERDIIVALKTIYKRYEFDTVYSALGMKARTDLAVKLGAKCNKDKILIVDKHQKTSVSNFYAVGDIVIGLNQICVALSQGAVAAVSIFNALHPK
jgi:thioredoxin reductase (NADPH)